MRACYWWQKYGPIILRSKAPSRRLCGGNSNAIELGPGLRVLAVPPSAKRNLLGVMMGEMAQRGFMSGVRVGMSITQN
jgi:hypothetical protein